MRLGTFHKKRRFFINKIKINLLSLFLNKKRNEDVNSKNIHSCLLIHDNNKIGDLIVLSSLYRELEKRGVKLSVLTTVTGKAFLSGNSKIHQFYIKESNNINGLIKVCNQLRCQHFDIVLDPFETMPSFGHSLLLFSLRSSYILGFDKWYQRYYSSYDLHDEKLTEHMCTRANKILSHLYSNKSGEIFDLSYDLPLPDNIEHKITNFVGDSNIVIINPLGAKKICRLTSEQIYNIYSRVREICPKYRVIFTGLPEDLQSISIPGIEILPYDAFIYTVALTKYSKFVISVDTALVHIASAYKIPTLALYPNSRHPSYPSHLIWAPNNCNAIQVVSSSFTVKDISPDVIVNSIDTLFEYKRSEHQSTS